jgi:hypothetical protein
VARRLPGVEYGPMQFHPTCLYNLEVNFLITEAAHEKRTKTLTTFCHVGGFNRLNTT